MVAIITVLCIAIVSMLITRIATVALTLTGLSRDIARFQARSAFSGAGFTTAESELLVTHPVRRRILMLLMFLGNVGLVTLIASLMGSFVGIGQSGSIGPPSSVTIQLVTEDGAVVGLTDARPLAEAAADPDDIVDIETVDSWWTVLFGHTKHTQTITRLLVLSLGLLTIWILASSKWVDRRMSRVISWALHRYTDIETHDYHGLLHLSQGYTVTQLTVITGDWLVGKSLIDLKLTMEGVQALSIQRQDGMFIGTPQGHTYIRTGDSIVLYGRAEVLAELSSRKAGEEGDKAHDRWVEAQGHVVEEIVAQDTRKRPRSDAKDPSREEKPPEK